MRLASAWRLAALAALPCHGQDAADNTPPSVQALRAHAAPTPDSMLAGAPASAWRALDPDDTLYVTLPQGRVVIELAPQFAPRYVANIKKLVRQGFFNGLPIFRVQDDAVAEWGDPTGRKSVGLARRMVAAEFERPSRDLPFTALPDPDTYAPQVGFSDGFPAARDPVFGRAWLANCYGMVGPRVATMSTAAAARRSMRSSAARRGSGIAIRRWSGAWWRACRCSRHCREATARWACTWIAAIGCASSRCRSQRTCRRRSARRSRCCAPTRRPSLNTWKPCATAVDPGSKCPPAA